jgi:glycosyltransferase involved in cell wall biosynthesis
MTQPAVYVVMPCHNCVQTVGRAIESIARQTLRPRAVVAVDDASSDDTPSAVTASAARCDLAINLVRLPCNAGPATARNAGWQATPSAADYVAFLDADDWWHDEKLARQVEWMQRHRGCAWSAHRVGWQDGGRRGANAPEDLRASPLTRTGVLARNPVATPSVMVRRDVPLRFRQGWRYCEDVMAWVDLLDAGCRGELLHAELAFLGRRPTSPGGLTGELAGMHAGERLVIETLRRESRLTDEDAAAWLLFQELKYRWRRIRSRMLR